jgi:hypothetical protein
MKLNAKPTRQANKPTETKKAHYTTRTPQHHPATPPYAGYGAKDGKPPDAKTTVKIFPIANFPGESKCST